jgi:hypothetical protein
MLSAVKQFNDSSKYTLWATTNAKKMLKPATKIYIKNRDAHKTVKKRQKARGGCGWIVFFENISPNYHQIFKNYQK